MDAMSLPRRFAASAPLLALLAAGACQSADVGQPCAMNLLYADGGPIAVDEGGTNCSAERADFFRSGAIECDNLVCLQSPTGLCAGSATTPYKVRPYCSKACVSNADCFTSTTGLVCRRVLLDPSFVASLPDGGAPYLPDALASNYCAPPPVQ